MSGRVKSAPGDRDAEQREVGTEGLSPARWVEGGGRRGVCSGTVAPGRDAGGQSGPPRAEAGETVPAPARNGQPRGRMMGWLQGRVESRREPRVQFRTRVPTRVVKAGSGGAEGFIWHRKVS